MFWMRDEVEARRMEEDNGWAWAWGSGWECVSEVLGGEWNSCSVDKAASWEGRERREVEIAVCGFWGSFGMGGRRGSVRG